VWRVVPSVNRADFPLPKLWGLTRRKKRDGDSRILQKGKRWRLGKPGGLLYGKLSGKWGVEDKPKKKAVRGRLLRKAKKGVMGSPVQGPSPPERKNKEEN